MELIDWLVIIFVFWFLCSLIVICIGITVIARYRRLLKEKKPNEGEDINKQI